MKLNLMKIAMIALAVAAPVLAGGLWLEFGNPSASSDPKAKDALAVVRATGCHEPEKALFSATAEGKVEGKRTSIPLEVVKLSTPGCTRSRARFPRRAHG